MIDARIQILDLLREIDFSGLTVAMNFPKTIKNVPLITFFEINNSNTNKKVRDSISWQIDVWTDNFESCIDLMQEIDDKMMFLGVNRDYVSPDSDAVDPSGFYRKTLRYSCNVDIRNNRIID